MERDLHERISDAFLETAFWGFHQADGMADVYRAPLPEIDAHVGRSVRPTPGMHFGPVVIKELLVPPYFSAVRSQDNGPVSVQLYFGSGVRANRRWKASSYVFDSVEDGEWIDADGANVPGEWLGPIAKALEDVREIWPDAEIRHDSPVNTTIP